MFLECKCRSQSEFCLSIKANTYGHFLQHPPTLDSYNRLHVILAQSRVRYVAGRVW